MIKIKNSLLVVIPADMCQLVGIEKGDYVGMLFLPPYGILLTKGEASSEIPIQLKRIASMKQAADNVYAELRRKARALEAGFTFRLYERMFGRALREGLLELHPPKEIREDVIRLLKPNPRKREGGEKDGLGRDRRKGKRS